MKYLFMLWNRYIYVNQHYNYVGILKHFFSMDFFKLYQRNMAQFSPYIHGYYASKMLGKLNQTII